MAAHLNGFKSEEDVKIKPDPAMDSPGTFEDDEDDDTGEIAFPKVKLPDGWLLRIPKELWEGLEALNDDDPVTLGDIKIWKMPNGSEKARLEVKKGLDGFNLIPKDYDLAYQPKPINTFSFTEKNLPGFKPNAFGHGRLDRPKPADRNGSPYRIDKTRPRGPKTIPKHTSYVGKPKKEAFATPRETDEWHRIQAEKLRLEEEAKASKPQMDIKEVNAVETATRKAFSTFVVTDGKKKARPQENKATRIAEDVLLDMLAAAFKEYKYWSMTALRQRTKQPEAWLKEVLSKVATRIDTGPVAGNWMLKPDAARIMKMVNESDIVKDEKSAKQEDVAPIKLENVDTDMDDVGDNDDDDDDVEFENALDDDMVV